MEQALGNIILTLVNVAPLLILYIQSRTSRRRKEGGGGNDNHEEDAEEAHAPAAPHHPPAPAGGHGHGGHGNASGALPWLLLALVLGILALVHFGKKAGFGVIPGVGGSSSVASRNRTSLPAWSVTEAPGKGWLVVSVLPGHTLSHCDLATDLVRCEEADPIEYRTKCTDANGHEHLWPEPCAMTSYMSFQSKTSSPAPIRWRDNEP